MGARSGRVSADLYAARPAPAEAPGRIARNRPPVPETHRLKIERREAGQAAHPLGRILIHDRRAQPKHVRAGVAGKQHALPLGEQGNVAGAVPRRCLLYTSDAADE